MANAARWLPPVMVVLCAFAYVFVEALREAFEVLHCICGHKQGEHEMTFVGRYAQSWGICHKCRCRAFIKSAA